MAKMTRYKAPTVRIDQVRNVDFAGLRESARQAQVIGDQIGQMQNFLEQRIQEKQQYEASQIVGEQGSKAATDIKAKGGPSTYLEKQVYEQGMRVLSTEVENKALAEMSTLLIEAEAQKLSPLQLRQQMDDIRDGFAASLSDVDGGTAAMLRAKLDGQAEQSLIKYNGIWQKFQDDRKKIDSDLGLQERMNMMRDAASLPVEPGLRQAAVNAHIADIRAFMEDRPNQYTGTQIANTLKEIQVTAKEEEIFADFSRLASTEKKLDFIKKLRDNPPKILEREDAFTLATKLKTALANEKSLYSGEVTALKAEMSDLKEIMSNGGMPKDVDIQAMQQRIDLLPSDIGGQVREDFAIFKQVKNNVDAMRAMNPAQLERYIGEIQEFKPDNQAKAQVLKQGQSLLSKMTSAIKKDPLSWHQQTGGKLNNIDLNPTAILAATAGDMKARQELQLGAKARINDAFKVQEKYGSKLRFLTDIETDGIVNQIEQLPAKEKVLMLGAIEMMFGQNAKTVFQQIAEKEPELGYIGGLSTAGGLDNATIALKGKERLDLKEVIPWSDVDAQTAWFRKTAAAWPENQAASKAASFTVAKAIYAELANKKGITAWDSSLWVESMNRSVGYDPRNQTGGYQSINGFQTIIPIGVTKDQVDAMLDNMTFDKLVKMTGLGFSEKSIRSLGNKNVRLEAVADGLYVPFIENGNGDKVPFKTQTGQLMELNVFKWLEVSLDKD